MNEMRKPNDSALNISARYERARGLLQGSYNKNVVFNDIVLPVWIEGADSFFYVRHTRDTQEYRLVDAAVGSNEVAFDHKALATALAKAADEEVDAANLPIKEVSISLAPLVVRFQAFDKEWAFDVAAGTCTQAGAALTNNESLSPDGKLIAFRRDYNLWVRDAETGEEKQLTTDGQQYTEYASESPAWGENIRPPEITGIQLAWSPDSKRIFTVQRDAREVKTIPVVNHVPQDGSLRPTVDHYKMALGGDEHIETNKLWVIEVETGRKQAASYSNLPTTRNSWGFFDSTLGWWGTDSTTAYFVDVDRYYKYARVVEFNTDTGACRILFEETTETHINLMLDQDSFPSYMPLPESEEILWYSERTGYAHYYLYCLKTGELKRQVTSGPGFAREIIRYAPERREAFVELQGHTAGRNVYYRSIARVNIDTGDMTLIADSDHDYVSLVEDKDTFKFILATSVPAACGGSPSGNYLVITQTRVDMAPVSYVIDRDGNRVLELEEADVSALPTGWQWPEPVVLKAADGKTDVYGVVYRPSGFDPNKSYPVLTHCFNQPEIHWAPAGSFASGIFGGWMYMDAAAVAELGFIVVQIDGRGSPEREKAFFDHSYGCFEKASDIDDHVAGIKQLAEKYPYMDMNRVGVAAHTAGGSGVMQGLLRHPDFYKVGTVGFYHDSRFISGPIQTDKYEGLDAPAHTFPEEYADKLQGKLLMMIGLQDMCTLPAATFRMIEAFRKANKDFDMIMLPNQGHEPSSYLIRRAWDYLVTHLMGATPPEGFDLDARAE